MGYDYIIVGAGLAGSIFAHEATKKGNKCFVVEKRDHIGGNCYTEEVEGITVHKYGAHIFHTSDTEIWDYINQFGKFNNFINSVKAFYKGKLYSLPFNMNTFYELWGTITPEEAKKKLSFPVLDKIPENLEEQAINLIGTEIYNILIKGYTEKQWQSDCKDLPPEIISRLPMRFTFNNNYFNDFYQGIPEDGYTEIFHKLLKNIDIGFNFKNWKEINYPFNKKIIYTGAIDEFFDYCYGPLDYRSLRFETEIHNIDNYQGNAVINYTEKEVPYTRIIEHKHFSYVDHANKKTVITKEYPEKYSGKNERYYPINNKENIDKYLKYKELANVEKKIIFAGRLGTYQYLDMDKVIKQILNICKEELV